MQTYKGDFAQLQVYKNGSSILDPGLELVGALSPEQHSGVDIVNIDDLSEAINKPVKDYALMDEAVYNGIFLRWDETVYTRYGPVSFEKRFRNSDAKVLCVLIDD